MEKDFITLHIEIPHFQDVNHRYVQTDTVHLDSTVDTIARRYNPEMYHTGGWFGNDVEGEPFLYCPSAANRLLQNFRAQYWTVISYFCKKFVGFSPYIGRRVFCFIPPTIDALMSWSDIKISTRLSPSRTLRECCVQNNDTVIIKAYLHLGV